jgi:alpha-1,3-rhamnosyl/mannosyltransferase
LRVLINELLASGPRMGIGHYTAELMRCLRQQAGENQVAGFPGRWVRFARRAWTRARPWVEIQRGPAHAIQRRARPGLARRLKSRLLGGLRQAGHSLLARHLRSWSAFGHYDLYHEPNFIPLPCDLPTVVTVHDLSVLLHPEWHPADRVAHYERHFQLGLARCVHWLTISEFARQEVIAALNLPPERVTRTYMGVRPELTPLPAALVQSVQTRLGLPPHYLLHVGTIEPRKNLLFLLQAYGSLPRHVREEWPLVLVGGWGWNSGGVAQYYEDQARHQGARWLGYVADEDLAAVYNGARALVFPTFYEGFGMPPLEMMACGGAVLASTAGAVVETAGRQAHFMDPRDTDAWRSAMLRVVTDQDWWQFLRTGAVEAARPFTWEACAAETLKVYRSVCKAASLPEASLLPLDPAKKAATTSHRCAS